MLIPRGYVLVRANTLEDLYDLAAIRQGQQEETISLNDFEQELRRVGRL